MQIQNLSLTHFRNYREQEVAFGPGLNLLSGHNGHGKTNLLEAIHYGCLAHSQRTRKDRELIAWDQGAFVLRLEGRIGEREHAQSVEYAESGSKRVKVNGSESRRLSDLLGHFSVVSFSPEDLDLIRSGPQARRRFLDILLCQSSLDYLDTLRCYNQALKQRNSLLKQMDAPRFGEEELGAYDAPLAEYGAGIILHRRRLLAELAPLAADRYRAIGDPREELGIALTGCVSEAGDRETVREDFLRKLASNRRLDRDTGTTMAGPHREDLLFLMAGKAVREFGSQGQKRSVALSLKLASARLLQEKNGHPPILLLDDVFAELDEARRVKIGALVRGGGQVFIANPRRADLPFEAERVITLERGSVV